MQNNVYQLFQNYFDNPFFFKVKNTDEHSIYMCRLHVHLANSTRYLVCHVPRDVYLPGDRQPLSRLQWIVFQCRSLQASQPLVMGKHGYRPKQGYPYNSSIVRVFADAEQTRYAVDKLPLEVTLLPDAHNTEYPPKGTLNAALETYNTVVLFI